MKKGETLAWIRLTDHAKSLFFLHFLAAGAIFMERLLDHAHSAAINFGGKLWRRQ